VRCRAGLFGGLLPVSCVNAATYPGFPCLRCRRTLTPSKLADPI
jgi:hypothetical protein